MCPTIIVIISYTRNINSIPIYFYEPTLYFSQEGFKEFAVTFVLAVKVLEQLQFLFTLYLTIILELNEVSSTNNNTY